MTGNTRRFLLSGTLAVSITFSSSGLSCQHLALSKFFVKPCEFKLDEPPQVHRHWAFYLSVTSPLHFFPRRRTHCLPYLGKARNSPCLALRSWACALCRPVF